MLPSAVFFDRGTFHTGPDARRMAQLYPSAFEPNPKRCVDDEQVLLGSDEVEVRNLLAAVFGRVREAADEAGGGDRSVVLTHPANWGPRRLRLLSDAASDAGLAPDRLVSEPVAAASYFITIEPALAESTTRRAGLAPTGLGGLFLTGGASRMPLVARLLHQKLGIRPTAIEHPELAVALGAMDAPEPDEAPMPSPPPEDSEQGSEPPGNRFGSDFSYRPVPPERPRSSDAAAGKEAPERGNEPRSEDRPVRPDRNQFGQESWWDRSFRISQGLFLATAAALLLFLFTASIALAAQSIVLLLLALLAALGTGVLFWLALRTRKGDTD